MTRKQALHKALEALEGIAAGTETNAANEASNEHVMQVRAACVKIRELLTDMPLVNWSEKSIFDTIDQFIIDHGQIPTVSDFRKKGLPPHTVIKLRFGMNLRAFLDMYYPTEKLNNSKIYFTKTRKHWQEFFVTEYHAIQPGSAEEYNSSRPEGSPSWQTIAKMFEIVKWLDWLNFCEITPYAKKREPIRGSVPPTQFYVTSVIRVTCVDGRTFSVTKDAEGVPYIIRGINGIS